MEKMVKTFSVLWIMAVCLTACNSRSEQWLDMAEACMEVNPDSAYDCLSHLAAMDDMAEGERARYALTGNPTKRMMCYLMALELDDEEMMYRATGKRLETIRKYHKECRQLVDSWMG